MLHQDASPGLTNLPPRPACDTRAQLEHWQPGSITSVANTRFRPTPGASLSGSAWVLFAPRFAEACILLLADATLL